jgi:DNA polymerase sigma
MILIKVNLLINLGGLSSYSLLITIVFYFKTNKKKENLGEILYEYFKLFGEDFDFTKYGIDINSTK